MSCTTSAHYPERACVIRGHVNYEPPKSLNGTLAVDLLLKKAVD